MGQNLSELLARWALPLAVLGFFAATAPIDLSLPIVRAQLHRIFAYRQKAVRRLLVGERR